MTGVLEWIQDNSVLSGFGVAIVSYFLSEFMIKPIINQRGIVNEIEILLEYAEKFYGDVHSGGYLGNFITDPNDLGRKILSCRTRLRNSLDSIAMYDLVALLRLVPSKKYILDSGFDLELISDYMDIRFRDKLRDDQKEGNKKEFDRRIGDVQARLKIPKLRVASYYRKKYWVLGIFIKKRRVEKVPHRRPVDV